MNQETILRIKDLKKEYSGKGLKYPLFDNITFEIKNNSFTTILSPRYSNKTLLLQVIAGFDSSTSGTIENFSNTIVYIPAKPSSLPWLNVKLNIEMGLKHNNSGKKRDISELIDLAGLQGYEDHFPHNKSLGFRFRIALARAIAVNPALIMIDEPFNDMDNVTKLEMYLLLRDIYIKTHITFLFATSNISEAVFLSERILIPGPETNGIIYDINNTLPYERDADLFNNGVVKEKMSEIEDLIKAGESVLLNSFLI